MSLTKLPGFTLDTSSNVTFANANVSGNLTAGNANLGNLAVANYYSGNGSLLTALTGANVAGFVPNANIANTAFAVAGANVSGAVSYATTANSVAGANVSGQVGNSLIAGTVYTNAQPNITSVGTLTSLSVTGDISSANLTLTGNLIVSGTTTTVNSTTTRVVDPIFELGGGANGAALSADDNKDRGLLLHYYTGATARDAFIGWDDSNSEFGVGSNVSVTNEVVTFTNYGNLRANFLLGNGYYLTGIDQLAAGSADVANSIANGTSNISTPSSGGNITVGIGGTPNTVIFTSTGIVVAGNANATAFNGNGESRFWNGTYADPDLGISRAIKVGNRGIAVLGGIKTDTLTVTGNVSGNFFTGNGYYLTGIDQLAAGSADVANSIANGTSNINTPISGGNITVGIGGVSNKVIFTSTGVNVAGHLTATANVSGTFIKGNGYYLTGVDQLAAGSADVANSIANGTSNVNTPISGGNITVGIGGTSNTVIFTSTGVNVAGYISPSIGSGTNGIIWPSNPGGGTGDVASIKYYAVTGEQTRLELNVQNDTSSSVRDDLYFSVAGYTVVNNSTEATSTTDAPFQVLGGAGIAKKLFVGGNIEAGTNYIKGNGYYLTGVDQLAAGSADIANSIANGTSNINTPTSGGNITVGIGGTPNTVIFTSTGVNIAGYATVVGNITGGNANLGNLVTANYFTGNGSGLSGLTFGNITTFSTAGLTIDELYLQATTRLNVTASGSSGYVFDQYGATVNPVLYVTSGQTLAFNLNVAGHPFLIRDSAGANYSVGLEHIATTGTVLTTTSAQGQVAGTLYWKIPYGITGNYKYQCSVHGGMNGNIVIADANVANITVGTANSVAVANVSGIGNIATINKDGNASNVLYGNGVFATIGAVSVASVSNGTSNITIATINGNITMGVAGNSNVVVVSGTGVNIAGYAEITGNITSGNANLGNLVTANYFTGNFYGNANTVTTNAQPNITSVGTLTGLTVGNATANTVFGNGTITATGNIAFTGANVSLGSVSNLNIAGGAADYYLKTNGAGGLSWSAVTGGGGGGGITLTSATSPPASGNLLGDQWYNTSSDVLYEYINDGTAAYWVDTSSPSTSSNSSLVGAIAIKDEGSNITNAVSSINFVGSAVTASNVGNAVTVTITADTVSPFLLMGA